MGNDDIEMYNVSRYTSRHSSHSPPTSSDDFETYRRSEDTALDSPSRSRSPTPSWPGKNATFKSKILRNLKIVWEGPNETWDSPPRPIQRLRFLEELPQKLRRKVPVPHQVLVFAIYLLFWLYLWSRIMLPYLVETPLDGNGSKVISLTCGQADTFWKGKNAACGLDAKDCSPLESTDDVIFRCPALCDRGSWLYSSRAVGFDIVKYRGYFIGGGARKNSDEILSYPYRADSFPCGAAVHSGLVSPFFGGCARVSYSSGAQAKFKDKHGHYGVSDSLNFDSFFPFSYVFKSLTAPPSHCHDPRLIVLLLNIILGAPVVYMASGVAFYWTLAIVGFWTIVTATDPPVLVEPENVESFYELISVGLERFLPTCFILYVLWMVSVRRTFGQTAKGRKPSQPETLNDSEFYDKHPFFRQESPLSRLLLWYPLFWVGVLNNVTFDRLPVDRLTWHDLQVQPGALMTVTVVSFFLIFCVVAQAYYVWLSGRFWRLLSVYGAIFFGLFLLGSLPGLSLRVHHYIFALVFIPGCSTRGRTAIAFQGILLGLFLSGVARWGYASIAETNLSLLRGEPSGQSGSPEITGFSSGLLRWQPAQNSTMDATVDSAIGAPISPSQVSLLINDVERFRGESNGTVDIVSLFQENEELQALLSMEPANKDTPVYLRLALFSEQKNDYGDYTRAAILQYPSFEFEVPPPGIT